MSTDRIAPLAAGRAVLDRALGRGVDLLGRQQQHGPGRGAAGGVDGQGDGRRCLGVGQVDDDVRVGLAEREVALVYGD